MIKLFNSKVNRNIPHIKCNGEELNNDKGKANAFAENLGKT